MAADPKPLEKWCGPSGAYVVFSDADLFAALDLERPGLDEARALAAEGRFPEAYSAWGRYWARREDPRWVFDPARWPDAIRRKMPWAVAVFRNLADRVVAHDLGGGPYQAVPRGRFVDWALDNGDTAYIGFHYFFWFPPLSRAYLLTGDEKYARAFVDVLCSWYDALPGIRNFDGVVWNRQLGSSLRATYFLEAYYCLRESASLTPELHEKLLKILLGHARYVHDVHMQQYTEWNGQNTGCAMLACLGSLLPEFRESGRWKDAAVPMLRRHILENFLPDGGHQELCMQYHVAGLRDLSLGARALRAAGDDRILSDPRLRARLREAFAWPLKVAFPSGFTPALNSGVVDKEWLTYMALGADLFDDAEFRWAARRFAGEQYLPVSKAISPALWQVDETVAGALHFREGGAMALREADEHVAGAVPSGEGGVAPSYRSVLLPDSGFAVLRAGWEPESMCLVLDFGTPWGGHGYPGKLSFTFWAYDALLAALPGSPASYSLPVYAEWCRQTRSQNTVLVGDRSPEPPFTARLESWHNLEDAVFVSASTEVYRPVRHVRAITFVPGGYFVVFDSLTGGPAGTPLSWLFHCPPGLTRGEGAAFASPAGGAGVLLAPAEGEMFEGMDTGVGHGAVPVEWSPRYQPADAWRDDIAWVGYRKTLAPEGSGYAVAVIPFRSSPPAVRVSGLPVTVEGEPVSPATARALVVSDGADQDLHLCRFGAPVILQCAGVETDAAQLWLRRAGARGTVVRAALAGGSRLVVEGTPLVTCEGVCGIALVWGGDGVRGHVEGAGPIRIRLWAPDCRSAIIGNQEAFAHRHGDFLEIAGHCAGVEEIHVH